jgi:hypothetical protein
MEWAKTEDRMPVKAGYYVTYYFGDNWGMEYWNGYVWLEGAWFGAHSLNTPPMYWIGGHTTPIRTKCLTRPRPVAHSGEHQAC